MYRVGRKRVGSREQDAAGVPGFEKDDFLKAQRREKMRLFMQDFVQQGKQIVADLKKRAQTFVSTTEKAFAVELLKMPTAVRQMKRRDFLSLKGDEEATVAAIMECLVDDFSIMKVETRSKRGKGTMRAVEHDEYKSPKTRAMSTGVKNRKLQKVLKNKSGVISASSRGSKHGNTFPRSACATPATKRYKNVSVTAIGFTSEEATPMPKRVFEMPILRSVCSAEKIQSASLNGSQLSIDLSVPLVNIPLADGQTLWSTGDDLETIDVELLHGDTVQHIHNLGESIECIVWQSGS
uniref:Borealin-2-like isoform X2 n=1 Tax=Geotrypetes seraphini TaxID=260995 RepID=A0A6P8QU85_GEOSA|nr:borealin-2-like isoform X2 [Geotrypetes seraphini]